MNKYRIGINGAGIGGLASAIALSKQGFNVVVFEQAHEFFHIGADINLTPNAVRALDGLGVGEGIRKTAARPTHRISRTWDTGEETSRLEMADSAEKHYGAPQLTMHRADLIDALGALLPSSIIKFGKKAINIDNDSDRISVFFEDGSKERVDVLVGADGIHSTVRRSLFGEEQPEFTGIVSFRAVIPQNKLSIPNLGALTKWWGPIPEMQIVTFPLNKGRDTFIFATTPQEGWTEESWTSEGNPDELREIYKDFHPEAFSLLEAITEVTKSALYIRGPLPTWSVNNATILGDAAHPMVPFMAQGACMAIEDAVVLGRAAEAAGGDMKQGFKCYEETRKERTAKVQRGSRGNEWLKDGGTADWVYSYNAWEIPLADQVFL